MLDGYCHVTIKTGTNWLEAGVKAADDNELAGNKDETTGRNTRDTNQEDKTQLVRRRGQISEGKR